MQEVVRIAVKVSSVTFRRSFGSPEGCRKSAAGQPSARTLSAEQRTGGDGWDLLPALQPAAPLSRPPVRSPLTRLSGVTSRSLPPPPRTRNPPMPTPPMWAPKRGTQCKTPHARELQVRNYTGKFSMKRKCDAILCADAFSLSTTPKRSKSIFFQCLSLNATTQTTPSLTTCL